jgi:hypothetical protein
VLDVVGRGEDGCAGSRRSSAFARLCVLMFVMRAAAAASEISWPPWERPPMRCVRRLWARLAVVEQYGQGYLTDYLERRWTWALGDRTARATLAIIARLRIERRLASLRPRAGRPIPIGCSAARTVRVELNGVLCVKE